MKRNVFPIAILFLFFTAFIEKTEDVDYLNCFKKYKSDWGEACPDCKTYKNSYRVFLKNECLDKLDVMVCVQESDKTWKRFMFNAMPSKDTMIAYACNGTGKYLKWAKKAGDKSIDFPSLEEVNATYKD